MKLLILGIDGADHKIMSQFKLKNWTKLCNTLTEHNVRLKDLWSRGWGELISGEHGSQTGALYARASSIPGVTVSKFTSLDYFKKSVPIWKKLNSRGLSVSLHNIPTTVPAPELNGYVICGGGAGTSIKSDNASPFFYPQKGVVPQLISNDYIRDVRYSLIENRSFENLFKQLDLMDTHHINTFCKLNIQKKIDVGFLVIRSLVVIQQLFIDIIVNPEVDPLIYKKIETHFKQLDIKIEKLLESLSPKNIVIVSDHGQSIKKYSINLNAVFPSTKIEPSKAFSKKIIFFLKKSTPELFKNYFKKNIIVSSFEKKLISNINPNSKIFANRYIPGVFVKGNSKEEQSDLILRIINQINSNKILKDLGIFAQKSEEIYPSHLYPRRDLLPNIIVNQPEEVFFETSGALCQPNKNLYQTRKPNDIKNDQHAGGKGYVPVAMSSFNFILDKDKRSLSDFSNAILENL